MKSKKSSLPLREIITQRLSLQANQRALSHRFDISIFNLQYFLTSEFLNTYLTWDLLKKREFARILGGPVNERDIVKLLDNYEKGI